MIETLSVSLSGPAFSFLQYENLKSRYSQEGFLLGEIVEKKTKTITDNDQQQVHISRVIKISCAVPCPHPFFFYDNIGRIDPEKIRNFLGTKTNRVVAWYKYKQSSSFSFSFREKIIHKQLANMFSVPPEFFSCCLLISESSDNSSTYSFTQTFMRCHSHIYEQLPLHIVNLSDANNAYKSQEKASETFANLVSGLNINHEATQGINIITKIQNALQKYTERMVGNIAEAEERVVQLQDDIKNLQEMARLKEVTSASDRRENQMNEMMDTDSEASPVTSPSKVRGRGRANSGSRRSNSQSPVKRSPGGHEIVTRSMKKV